MSGDRGAITEAAYAKINLYLHITGIRDNGYHELDSAFVFADVGDRLDFSHSESLVLDVSGPFADFVPLDDDNLVLRAAKALAEVSGTGAAASIHLEKNLPAASGIGGGSADAAAALRGLNRLWETGLADHDLARIGASLGADVPACVFSRALQVSGIGEMLNACAALPACPVLLVNPGVAVPTGEIFKRFDATPVLGVRAPLEDSFSVDDLAAQLEDRSNDLEVHAVGLVPEISKVLEALRDAAGCRFARMSGSGATCFGLFADRESARLAAEAISADRPGWWVAAGQLRP